MSEVLSAWERLMIARMADRPTALDYIDRIFTSFVELHGDRAFGDDKSIVSGIGLLDDEPVTIIGIQRGRDIKENIERNFGSPNPEGYRKALRHMQMAEKFNRPIICLVDTKGAFCGVGAEERGQGEAIARNLMEMAGIDVPIISIIIGEGGSGGALALALADRVWMLENSIYSILSPEGFASILWKDSKRAKEAAEVMKITSMDLYKMGVIDKIIKETKGGAQKDVDFVSMSIRENLIKEVKVLKDKTKEELLEFRYRRFRKYGEFDYI